MCVYIRARVCICVQFYATDFVFLLFFVLARDKKFATEKLYGNEHHRFARFITLFLPIENIDANYKKNTAFFFIIIIIIIAHVPSFIVINTRRTHEYNNY